MLYLLYIYVRIIAYCNSRFKKKQIKHTLCNVYCIYTYIYIYIYINLPEMSRLPTSPFPKRGTSGPGNVFSTLC